MRLLLIEDNERLAGFVRAALEAAGFATDAFGEGGDALAALGTTRYDAVVLDLGLPDLDGLDLLRQLRNAGNAIPILILTARDGIGDRVAGLNAGADDYLLKPFATEELIARIRALLRRPGGALGAVLAAGNLAFDTVAREVTVDGRVVAMSRREMTVLEELLRRSGRVVPKALLEESIYAFDDDVSSNAVEVNVSRLRKRLQGLGASVGIHTLRGVGYLLAETEE